MLTAAYHGCYSDANEDDELSLLTAPLASTAEVRDLYQAGLIDVESALPTALHSLGMSSNEIEGALKRRREADKNAPNAELMEAQTSAKLGEVDAQLKAAQTEKTVAETEKTRAEVAKVGAETKKTEHDAKAPLLSQQPAAEPAAKPATKPAAKPAAKPAKPDKS